MASFLMARRPDGDHDDDDGDELKQNPQPHQLLRAVRRAAPQHIEKTEQQNDYDRGYCNGNNERTEKRAHLPYITPQRPVRHCRLIWLLAA